MTNLEKYKDEIIARSNSLGGSASDDFMAMILTMTKYTNNENMVLEKILNWFLEEDKKQANYLLFIIAKSIFKKGLKKEET